MSRERGSDDERGQQRTVAELLAQYGDSSGANAPRRRRRRADDPSDTAPQAIIDRVVSESGQMRAIRDEPEDVAHGPAGHSGHSAPPDQGPGHRSGYRPQQRPPQAPPQAQPPTPPPADRSGPTRAAMPPVPQLPQMPPPAAQSIPSMPPVPPASTSRPSMPPVQPPSAQPPPGFGGRPRGPQPPQSAQTSGPIPLPPPPGRAPARGMDSRTDLGRGGPSSGPISAPLPGNQLPGGPPPGEPPSRRNMPPQRPGTVSSRLDGGPAPEPMTEQLPKVPEGQPDAYEPDEPPQALGGPGGSGPRRRPGLPRRGGRPGFGPGPVPPGTQSQAMPVPPPEAPPTGGRMPPAGPPDRFPYGGADTTVAHGGGTATPAPFAPVPADTGEHDGFDAFGTGDDYGDDLRDDRRDRHDDDLYDGYDEPGRHPDDLDDLDDLDDRDDFDEDYDKPPQSPAREWALMAAQLAGGVLGGAAIWLAFNWLWGVLPAAALVVAIVVTVGLVLVVRKIRRAEDLQTTVLAVLVGLIVTVSPAALLLLKR